MDENDVKRRVQEAMKTLEVSAYAIAKSCNMNERTIYEQTNGGSKISVATLEAFLAYRPDLSAEWLLRGAGSMLLSMQQNNGHQTATKLLTKTNEGELCDTIRRQQREIDGLYERINEQKRFIEYIEDTKKGARFMPNSHNHNEIGELKQEVENEKQEFISFLKTKSTHDTELVKKARIDLFFGEISDVEEISQSYGMRIDELRQKLMDGDLNNDVTAFIDDVYQRKMNHLSNIKQATIDDVRRHTNEVQIAIDNFNQRH